MISPRHLHPDARVKNPRAARTASERRKVRTARARYAGIGRLSAVIAIVLPFFMGYVVLTSSLTGTSYAIASAHERREALLEETMRLDDRLAALRSDQRLSAVAARLGMRDPQRIALVTLPAARPAADRTHVALLSSLAGWFSPATRQR
jgi:hypothetical protein